jgi:hypothetical protein
VGGIPTSEKGIFQAWSSYQTLYTKYVSTEEDKEWLYRSLVGNILPNFDVATMEATILQTVDKAVSFRFLGASQGIITFVDRLSAQQEQAKEGSLLQSLFSNLRQWEGRTRAHDRFAWIAIFGLPMEGWNKNCIDTLLQSWGNIVGYDTTCVSQGSISGIRVLINTIKLEPLHDQVILELDGAQVDVILQEIKGELIPSLTTVKHSMDVSLYTESVLSDDEAGEVEVEVILAASIPRLLDKILSLNSYARGTTKIRLTAHLSNLPYHRSTCIQKSRSYADMQFNQTTVCTMMVTVWPWFLMNTLGWLQLLA